MGDVSDCTKAARLSKLTQGTRRKANLTLDGQSEDRHRDTMPSMEWTDNDMHKQCEWPQISEVVQVVKCNVRSRLQIIRDTRSTSHNYVTFTHSANSQSIVP